MTAQTYTQWQEGLEKENNKWRTITIEDVMGKIGTFSYSGVEIDALVNMTFTRDGLTGPIEITDAEYKYTRVYFSIGEASVSELSIAVRTALEHFVDVEVMKYIETVPDYNWTVVENE